ncbi:DMT family transporter [Taklimakanibacter deserti]|uniref:DMT family transporter n=1 Tax=Taklimakanibacter deserti TaxID=2267839 RepID=UPI000E64617E
MKTETLAKFACAYSGMVWGLFWIPIRSLDQAGIGGLWATFFFYTLPFALCLPILLVRWRPTVAGGLWLQLLGFMAALSLVAYSVSILYTDVVRATLLFYLTPLWSTLLARIFLGEPITLLRWVAMAVALLGMLVIFRADAGIPLPERPGDWIALGSGFLWSVAAILLRADKESAAIDLVVQNFIWSAVVAAALLLFLGPDPSTSPPLAVYLAQLPWLVPTILIVVMTGVFASMWGTPKLNPGLVGLLFMTEISVGAITAALWSGDPFGWREAIGIILISVAGMMESLWELWRRRGAAVQLR